MLNSQNRLERLAALEATPFDLLVIGGGITGAAVARDAAARGLSVALLERDDWASGTSSRSSKLIHGGLRYLKTGNVRLVFESLSERARLSRLAPHLVRPTDFLFPSYRGRGLSPLELTIGLTLYDLLALGRSPRWHRRLSRAEVLNQERLLDSPELAAAGLYSDARTDDARLTLENVLDAAALGAVAVSRVTVEALQKDRSGRVRGAGVRDGETGRALSVHARLVVNATGPWGDRVRSLDDPAAPSMLRLSRGAHLVVPASRLPVREAIAFPMEDGRLLFAIPFDSVTLVGTTDTDHPGPAGEVFAAAEDVAYILAAARRTFPAAALAESDVLSTFAGLRPLGRQPGRGVGETSREESVSVSASGLVTVIGGKLTTHRRMAEKAVDRAGRILARDGVTVASSSTRDRPYPGKPSTAMPEFLAGLTELCDRTNPGLTVETLTHLAYRYGRRAEEIVGLTAQDRALGRPIVEGLPDLDAEIVFAARAEDARSLSDVFARRTHLSWRAPRGGEEAAERAADLLARELGWTADQRRASLDAYARELSQSREWSKGTKI